MEKSEQLKEATELAQLLILGTYPEEPKGHEALMGLMQKLTSNTKTRDLLMQELAKGGHNDSVPLPVCTHDVQGGSAKEATERSVKDGLTPETNAAGIDNTLDPNQPNGADSYVDGRSVHGTQDWDHEENHENDDAEDDADQDGPFIVYTSWPMEIFHESVKTGSTGFYVHPAVLEATFPGRHFVDDGYYEPLVVSGVDLEVLAAIFDFMYSFNVKVLEDVAEKHSESIRNFAVEHSNASLLVALFQVLKFDLLDGNNLSDLMNVYYRAGDDVRDYFRTQMRAAFENRQAKETSRTDLFFSIANRPRKDHRVMEDLTHVFFELWDGQVSQKGTAADRDIWPSNTDIWNNTAKIVKDGRGEPVRDDGWNQPVKEDGWGEPVRDDGWNQPVKVNGWGEPVKDYGWGDLNVRTNIPWTNAKKTSAQPLSGQHLSGWLDNESAPVPPKGSQKALDNTTVLARYMYHVLAVRGPSQHERLICCSLLTAPEVGTALKELEAAGLAWYHRSDDWDEVYVWERISIT